MSEQNWALAAIEREATRRAEDRLARDPQTVRVVGLSIPQIIELKHFYELSTGKRASDLIKARFRNGGVDIEERTS